MTAASTIDKPVTSNTKQPPPNNLQHIYCKCDRGQPVRLAFCGHKGGGSGRIEPYVRGETAPQLCNVCVYMEEKVPCQRCKAP